jgi:hypothetical protein
LRSGASAVDLAHPTAFSQTADKDRDDIRDEEDPMSTRPGLPVGSAAIDLRGSLRSSPSFCSALSLGVASAVVTSNQAQLSFSLPEAGRACLELYDVRGARVATLRDGEAGSGRNLLTWSSGSPASFPENGVYFLRLIAKGKTANAKVVFAR